VNIRHKPWLWFSAIQLTGAVLTFSGADRDLIAYLAGLVLLLPGSFPAAYLPTERLWRPYLWDHFGTDAAGLRNVLYLPFTVLINICVFYLVRLFLVRRTAHP